MSSNRLPPTLTLSLKRTYSPRVGSPTVVAAAPVSVGAMFLSAVRVLSPRVPAAPAAEETEPSPAASK